MWICLIVWTWWYRYSPISQSIKVTSQEWCQNSRTLQPLDVFACNWKDGLLAELQAKISRGCRFLLFWHHSYEVTLKGDNLRPFAKNKLIGVGFLRFKKNNNNKSTGFEPRSWRWESQTLPLSHASLLQKDKKQKIYLWWPKNKLVTIMDQLD